MKNQNNISELLSYWLEKIDPRDRSTVRELWDEAEQADEADQLTITEQEKAESLAQIKRELGLDKNQTGIQKPILSSSPVTYLNWRWAAAAILVLAAGISYLLIPVQQIAPLGEQKVVQLPDDTQVTLNSGSTLRYNRLYGITHRNTHLNGEGHFEVTSNGQPFTVQTFNASVKVLGTKFNVRSWSDEPNSETTVTLTEGKVQFQSLRAHQNSVLLTSGQASSLGSRSTHPTEPDVASVFNTLSWMENRFAFEDRPLWMIINELERRYNITIQVQSSRILTDSLTLYKSSGVDAEEIIKDICINKGVSYRPLHNGFVITN